MKGNSGLDCLPVHVLPRTLGKNRPAIRFPSPSKHTISRFARPRSESRERAKNAITKIALTVRAIIYLKPWVKTDRRSAFHRRQNIKLAGSRARVASRESAQKMR